MIFNDFDILAPPQGPRRRGQKKCAVACSIHVSSSHTKFGWISSNGLGKDSIMDGQTDGGDCNIPDVFFKSVGIMTKGVRALRGYFGPPMRSKNKSCSSQDSFY